MRADSIGWEVLRRMSAGGRFCNCCLPSEVKLFEEENYASTVVVFPSLQEVHYAGTLFFVL